MPITTSAPRQVRPPGNDGEVLLNVSGDFSSDPNLTWSGTQLDVVGSLQINNAYTLPTADGSEKQILETDGAGNVDWQDNPSYKLVRNNSGSTIGAGNIVRINDSFGAISTIVVADNSTCSCADGITIESIANGDNGLIQLKGVIQESFINTDALTAGNVVYLGTSGGYTDIKPSSGFVIKVGKVGVEAPSGGSLLLSMPAYATDFEDLSGDVNLSTQVAGILPVANGGTGVASSASYTNPTGSMIMYGGSTAPSGWLLCDGSAVSRTGYSALFSVIGTSYGVGNGFSTFNLPDMRRRFPVGLFSSDLGFDALGKAGGAGSHSHTLSDNGYALAETSSSGLFLRKKSVTPWTSTVKLNASVNSSAGLLGQGTVLGGETDTTTTYPPFQVFNFIIKT